MLLALALFLQITAINAVCFIAQEETVPRVGLKIFQSATLASCKLECIRNAQCQSIAYNSTLKLCVFHGDPFDKVCHGIPRYTRLVKTVSNCPQPTPTDLVLNYVPDPCLQSAVFSPEYTITDRDGICPYNVMAGDTKARNYVVSIILHDGSFDVYDNNAVNRLQWDGTLNSWVVYLYYGGRLLINAPAYAVTCAYYPTDVAPECPCPDLPLEPPGTTKPSVAPAPMCAGQVRYYQTALMLSGNQDGTKSYLRCLARKWILFSPAAWDGNQNSWIVTTASCL